VETVGSCVAPSPRLGVVGAGQLARMMQPAAIQLGLALRLLAETNGAPAAQVIPQHVVGDYRDLETLRRWADGCDVVTFDHEHVPTGHLEALESSGSVCRPSSAALVYAQDKERMRDRLTALGVPCPRHAMVSDAAMVNAFAKKVDGYPVVLKATRGGYDGKGVWVINDEVSAMDTIESLRGGASGPPASVLVEEHVPFTRELAGLVARSPSGQVAAYPIVETIQRGGVCDEVIVPAPGLRPELANAAQRLAMQIAADLDVTGILAVELFELSDGRVLVNELAMRPHNTGHWSIDAAVTSQFENHLRAVLDLPLGAPHLRERWAVMVNILGGDMSTLPDGFPHVMARDPFLRVHLYGKEVRPGRKVGHVTAYGQDLADVRARARHAAQWFTAGIDDNEEPYP
jgi:5-(carboxyamino)imidazole ribonucleotide synthase